MAIEWSVMYEAWSDEPDDKGELRRARIIENVPGDYHILRTAIQSGNMRDRYLSTLRGLKTIDEAKYIAETWLHQQEGT